MSLRCVTLLAGISLRRSFSGHRPVVPITYRHHAIEFSICTRLSQVRAAASATSGPTNTQDKKRAPKDDTTDVSMIRNIGIMAHIDAGKTTTTERMLYYSGFTRHLGDVDDGDTVTDYMEQERERGITITSAAVTFFWNKHKINLIDTPGHVDFTLEVERCLRVLDGAITVIDASAGVEAQTLTVWSQADRYRVPRIVFINKMDKHSADFSASVQSVSEKLSTVALPIQIPIGRGIKFVGVVDLLTLTKFIWTREDPDDDGKEFCMQELQKTPEDTVLYDEAVSARSHLVEILIELDEVLAEEFLSLGDVAQISAASIGAALRRVIIAQKGVAVLCGSALRNCAIQPLLDAIVDYLPNPTERQLLAHSFVEYYGTNLCALAFKTVHDRQRGPLTFVRLYAGSVMPGATIYNINRACVERCIKLYQVYADEHREVGQVSVGNIAAISGLKQTITGDTLVGSHRIATAASQLYRKANNLSSDQNNSESDVPESLVLAGVDIPDPVFFCSVEPPSLAQQKMLDYALECLVREDPSLRVRVDADTGQTILGGMGELHLDIVHDRIRKEYGVEAYFGPLQIAYRECISAEAVETTTVDKKTGDVHHLATVCLKVQASGDSSIKEPSSKHPKFSVVPNSDSLLAQKPLRRDHIKAVENGISSGLARGPILGFPVLGVHIELHDLRVGPGTSVPMITACVAQCIYQAVSHASPLLMEPLMKLEITVDEQKLGAVLADLAQRRCQIHEVNARQNARIVIASAPLAELRSYATTLRTITSGLASFSMELAHYEQMSKENERKTVHSVTGL